MIHQVEFCGQMLIARTNRIKARTKLIASEAKRGRRRRPCGAQTSAIANNAENP